MTQNTKRLPASLWHRQGHLSLAWAGGCAGTRSDRRGEPADHGRGLRAGEYAERACGRRPVSCDE
jgi:hypothetical protein